jgi:hypothetical protein
VKKVIERLEQVESFLFERFRFGLSEGVDNKPLEKRIDMLKEAIAELEAPPRWETPEQWEKRTGKAWPNKAAVYYRCSRADFWVVSSFGEAKRDIAMSFVHTADIVCATEAGPPPDGWQPEEESR